jgi:hypothetical protein
MSYPVGALKASENKADSASGRHRNEPSEQAGLAEGFGPFSGRVIDAQNLNLAPLDAVSNNIWQVMDDQFVGASYSPRSTASWVHLQLLDCNPYPVGDFEGGPWIVIRDVILDGT